MTERWELMLQEFLRLLMNWLRKKRAFRKPEKDGMVEKSLEIHAAMVVGKEPLVCLCLGCLKDDNESKVSHFQNVFLFPS